MRATLTNMRLALKSMWMEILGNRLRKKPTDYRVQMIGTGPDGDLIYIRNPFQLKFWWAYSGPGISINAPRPEEWEIFCADSGAEWAKTQRRQVLQEIGEEIRIQSGFEGKVVIDDKGVDVYMQ